MESRLESFIYFLTGHHIDCDADAITYKHGAKRIYEHILYFIDTTSGDIFLSINMGKHQSAEADIFELLKEICDDDTAYNNIASSIKDYLDKHYIISLGRGCAKQWTMRFLKPDHNPNIDYIEFLLTKLTRRDILEQLAEEASEVANAGHDISMSASFIAQYAIKNIRATEDTENKTPEDIKSIDKQLQGNINILNSVKNKSLEEECCDLNMCLDLLYHLNGDHPIEQFNTLDNPKWERWAKRLGFISF